MSFAIAVEIVLILLLGATLAYCAILERRLSALRKGQDGFKETIVELNQAIITAGVSMKVLKSSVAESAETLDDRLSRARGLSDELALLTSSGERIAQRIERGAAPQTERTRPAQTPSVLASRLDALRPASMGHVR
jgi:hypothetical protein